MHSLHGVSGWTHLVSIEDYVSDEYYQQYTVCYRRDETHPRKREGRACGESTKLMAVWERTASVLS